MCFEKKRTNRIQASFIHAILECMYACMCNRMHYIHTYVYIYHKILACMMVEAKKSHNLSSTSWRLSVTGGMTGRSENQGQSSYLS